MSHTEPGSPVFWFSQTTGLISGPHVLCAFRGTVTSQLRVSINHARTIPKTKVDRRLTERLAEFFGVVMFVSLGSVR